MSAPGGQGGAGVSPDAAVFVISVAAELAGMHPQTLRQYDRLGLVSPSRSSGRGRRYSPRDVVLLREVQRLSQEEGVNLAGVKRILELEQEVGRLQQRVEALTADLQRALEVVQRSARVFAAGTSGDVVAVERGRRPSRSPFAASGALVVWRPHEG